MKQPFPGGWVCSRSVAMSIPDPDVRCDALPSRTTTPMACRGELPWRCVQHNYSFLIMPNGLVKGDRVFVRKLGNQTPGCRLVAGFLVNACIRPRGGQVPMAGVRCEKRRCSGPDHGAAKTGPRHAVPQAGFPETAGITMTKTKRRSDRNS